MMTNSRTTRREIQEEVPHRIVPSNQLKEEVRRGLNSGSSTALDITALKQQLKRKLSEHP